MEQQGEQILLPFPDDGPPTIADINQLWNELRPQVKKHIFGTPLPDGDKEKRRAWNLVRRGFGSLRNIVFIQDRLSKRR